MDVVEPSKFHQVPQFRWKRSDPLNKSRVPPPKPFRVWRCRDPCLGGPELELLQRRCHQLPERRSLVPASRTPALEPGGGGVGELGGGFFTPKEHPSAVLGPNEVGFAPSICPRENGCLRSELIPSVLRFGRLSSAHVCFSFTNLPKKFKICAAKEQAESSSSAPVPRCHPSAAPVDPFQRCRPCSGAT